MDTSLRGRVLRKRLNLCSAAFFQLFVRRTCIFDISPLLKRRPHKRPPFFPNFRPNQLLQYPSESAGVFDAHMSLHPEIRDQTQAYAQTHQWQRLVINSAEAVVFNYMPKVSLRAASRRVWEMAYQTIR